MAENRIELKSVGELLGMKFFIPSYQRGYRWTSQQVVDLINDIDEFRKKNKSSKNNNEKDVAGDFYCLQPLVVKECIENKDVFIDQLPKSNDKDCNILEKARKAIADNTKWEVIDGQQRLTTIYILLSFLQGERTLYSIDYQTRNEFNEFLVQIMDDSSIKSFNYDNDPSLFTNIVYKDIIAKNREWDKIDFYYILQTLITIRKWFWGKQNEELINYRETLLKKVKFIWYESVDEDPIKVFTRLNIGKISLTNAELIKALLLNRTNFSASDIDHLKLRQREIASEWDVIEYSLQNDEFWLFLNDTGYNRPTRIDFIFDLICKQNKLELDKEKYKLIGSDDYRTFRYFYEYFNTKQSSIKTCWDAVKAYFQTFKEWFDDLELYHYVGYLVIYGHSISDLVAEWNSSVDKESFVRFLKGLIRNEINKCPSLDFQYKEDGSDKGKCKPILLFHNIQTVVNQNKNNIDNEKYQLGVFYKFPFHLYKLENWDVEHINSNTTNEEDDTATQKEWLLNVYLSADKETQIKIRDYFEKTNDDQKSNLFKEIKNNFPQTEDKEWTCEEKNRIWNYTLLDSSTNRGYGNAIFSGKRRVIIGKDKGRLIPIPKITKDGKLQLTEETKAKSSFVPQCTKQVFMKYYSATMSDANYWTRIDADGYLNDIANCLKKIKELED